MMKHFVFMRRSVNRARPVLVNPEFTNSNTVVSLVLKQAKRESGWIASFVSVRLVQIFRIHG